MRLRRIESTTRIPGMSQITKRITAEWICPDCDYFEEAGEVET